jgi:hypothetical protein
MEKTFPEIDYCLLCEDVRPEPGNKINILGFFGLLPRVEIRVQKWEETAASLLFVVSAHGGYGEFDVRAKLLSPSGNILMSSEVTKLTASPEDLNTIFGFGFDAINFREQGQHRFELRRPDGVELYKNTFNVVRTEVPFNVVRATSPSVV